MKFISTEIPGLVIVEPHRFEDARGYFVETFNQRIFNEHVGYVDFVQDNESMSIHGVLRGLHLQQGDHSQAKLVRVVDGSVFDVVVDLRPESPTFGRWFGTELSGQNARMLFVPRHFAHGFLVTSEKARFVYKVDNYYCPDAELTIAYNDPHLDISWPELKQPYILSQRDLTRSVSWQQFLARCADAQNKK